MTLRSRLFEACKLADAVAGGALARALGPSGRPLPAAPRDVLVCRLWGLGNFALMAPLLQPEVAPRLRVLTLHRNAAWLRSQAPHVELLTLREPPHPGGPADVRAALAALRADPPDVVVDGETFLTLPALIVRLSCGAPIVGLSSGGARAPLLDHPVPDVATRHAGATFVALARAAGLRVGDGPGPLRVDDDARRQLAAAWPDDGRPLVVVHPGSGDHAPGRRWPAARFAEVCRALVAQDGARVALTGQRAERALLDEVAGAGGPRVVPLAGRLAPQQLLALLERADLLLTNDTGPLHLADALGTPVVALHGPSAPWRCGPRRAGSVALTADLPCSPCMDDARLKRIACRRPLCMQLLTVDDVLAACRRALVRPAPPVAQAHALAR